MLRRGMLSATALLALTLTGLSAGPATAQGAQGAQPVSDAAPAVVLHTVKDPNLVVDLDHGNPAQGTPVILFGAHGGANQQWEVVPVQGDWFQLRNKASGTCLVNGFHSVENGHGLTGSGCNKSYADQLWTRVPVEGGNQFTLVNKYSGKCMDQTLDGRSMTPVTQWSCHGLVHQRFTAETV
ncbi:RICIN domain-containing protein [Streptomyces marispadix]|uniref:RICIN domain-containing protein n=1 Tax=Streptomyces marispadix TaxID=2922868 RepID=A0ABS9SZ90_9ACTN|nr:RICIN domain-containing protein [Streptomyces marispadix]MCH6161597.1 RICIN domain-containing protein [Streptomyces marispadix]